MATISIGSAMLHVHDEGRGPPLLLVHGFPLDNTMWREQIKELSGSCRILAPDLRGFGQSTPVTASDAVVTMTQFANELAEMLTQL